ncbi:MULTISPECIES: HD-GYP domain-containing protein [unclassified Agarivorans]|uniref:HD-GYP domain-containing protein n=1 Tax=unclassified Agarivorans TaxID=2636026 RepID=UPI0026E421A6|nr:MULTISPECIES: two-component system response regulator [unclassified Agarivorans]MDO6685899.1 two-component system response regulator [Agarivorans sp. 3_MG-2023]MDO6713963.1 two-component system response regulator [Agarivorans sp. 2_MG-2023]
MENRATVLIVDDTPENIDVLAGILREDYKIQVARNGDMALKIVSKANKPDLILLDIMMPGIDGFEVCRRLKDDLTTRHIPVVFVTAKISPADELHGLELGAVDYITKPVSPPVVKVRVKTHLALFNQNRELDRKVKEQTDVINTTRLQIIQRLGRAAEYKDNETGLHVIRMSHYSKILGIAAGMSEPDADVLMNAAPMHDIGKIGIPDSVLQKPGKLDADEWDIMQSHAVIGGEILGEGDSSELLDLAKTVALTHHEKWDGSGYPNGLAGEDIPIVGRIVAIADVFDALTSQRPYKQAWPVEKAVDLLKSEAGTHFDPTLVPLFIAALPEILEIKAKFEEKLD